MIVTEQPKDPYECIWNYLKECQENKSKGIVPLMDEMFGGEFLKDFNPEDAHYPFRKFYWTHFIKCPGNIRMKKSQMKETSFLEGRLSVNACANKHLCKEVKALRPRLIVCMGGTGWKMVSKANRERDTGF